MKLYTIQLSSYEKPSYFSRIFSEYRNEMGEFLRTVNWRSTGYGIGYFVCYVFGQVYPSLTSLCELLEPLIVTMGLVSTADASRVRSIVRAVDVIAFKAKVDPATLVPFGESAIK